MKNSFYILVSFFIFIISCQTENNGKSVKENKLKPSEAKDTERDSLKVLDKRENAKGTSKNLIDSITEELDQMLKQNQLTKYSYPNMSACGGAVDGYFKDSTLLVIDATYAAELGFSNRKVYWNNGNIIKIVYREHFAEWKKYSEKYPSDQYEWDPDKMTYTDTVYHITLGESFKMQKKADNKVVSEKLNVQLIERLMKCGQMMKQGLETEKVKE